MWDSAGRSCMQDGHQGCHVAATGKWTRTGLFKKLLLFSYEMFVSVVDVIPPHCDVPQLQTLSLCTPRKLKPLKSHFMNLKLVFQESFHGLSFPLSISF